MEKIYYVVKHEKHGYYKYGVPFFDKELENAMIFKDKLQADNFVKFESAAPKKLKVLKVKQTLEIID